MNILPPDIPELQLGMMPDSQSMAMYGDKMIVYDNISTPLAETYSEEVAKFVENLPYKIDFTIVILILEGRLDIDCNLQHFSLGSGDVMVFVPGTIGEGIKIAPDSKMIVLSLSDDSLAPVGSLLKSLLSSANFIRPVKFQMDHEMIWPAVQEYQHLKRAILNKNFINDDLVRAYISVLASYAAISLERWKEKEGQKLSSNVPGNKLYNKFLELLEKNYIDHKDVAFYADACCLSPKYFSRQILAVSGKHPLEWIKAHVVLNAQAMLHSGEYSLSQVSEALKFSSQSAFNRYFKDETGMTPSEYQKR